MPADGTGLMPRNRLGEGFLVWNGRQHLPILRGGHADYAAQRRHRPAASPAEIHRTHQPGTGLRKRPGLSISNEFLREVRTWKTAWYKRIATEDPTSLLIGPGGQERDCKKAMDMLVSAYGAEA